MADELTSRMLEALRGAGAIRIPHALATHLPDLRAQADRHEAGRAGIRIGAADWARFGAARKALHHIARAALGEDARAVRAILFDKSAAANWSLAWHQDRTICVRERINAPGFGPWTVKQGLQHVSPPFGYTQRMITMRVHLDAVDADNAPLMIAPGSHRLGLVREADIPEVVAQCGQKACLAEPGDLWIYATAILHASEAARAPRRRRVLQVDYSADALPGGLEWLELEA